jgi:hypothetical protein
LFRQEEIHAMKRIRVSMAALLLTIALTQLGPVAHLDLPGMRVSPALASGQKETWDQPTLSNRYGQGTAMVDGIFSYNGSTVGFVGWGSIVGTGGFATGSWSLTSDQGPGYFFNSGSTQITFWYNQKFIDGHGDTYCLYPRAEGYSNGTTNGATAREAPGFATSDSGSPQGPGEEKLWRGKPSAAERTSD